MRDMYGWGSDRFMRMATSLLREGMLWVDDHDGTGNNWFLRILYFYVHYNVYVYLYFNNVSNMQYRTHSKFPSSVCNLSDNYSR